MGSVTAPGVVVTLIDDDALSDSIDRVVAAAGLRVRRIGEPSRRNWLGAAAVVLDEEAARRCARDGLPRRGAVFMVGTYEPTASTWTAALAVGAEELFEVPRQDTDLMRGLAEAAEAGGAGRGGRVIAVTAGRGGGGASVFAAALAVSAAEALLVDLDPCGGGIDLLLGAESTPGLRWPDLGARGGRIAWSAIREVLPRRQGISVLSAGRDHHDLEPGPVAAVLEAGRRGGATVVCDVPRQLTPAGLCALERADLVLVITPCDVRAVAATAALVSVIRTINPQCGLVVRGPSPGGLGAREAAAVITAPLLAAMRPQPSLARQLEHGGLRLRHRSPLAVAARTVLTGFGEWAGEPRDETTE